MCQRKTNLYTMIRSFAVSLRHQVDVPPKPEAQKVRSHLDFTESEKTAMKRYGFLPDKLRDSSESSFKNPKNLKLKLLKDSRH